MSKKLTTFEKCNAIKRTILRAAAESIMYESWNKDFKLKNLLEVPELEKLEFGKWDKESSLMLIPIWLYPYLADNLKTISISGSEHTIKAEIDDDHRFGNLAYGVIK
jgi:hypothetical protein